MTNKLQDKVRHKINQTNDFRKKMKLIEMGKRCFQTNYCSNIPTREELSDRFEKTVQTLNISSFELNAFDEIRTYLNSLNLIKSLIKFEDISITDDLKSILNQMNTFLNDLQHQVQTDAEKGVIMI